MSLSELLAQTAAQSAERMPPEALEAMRKAGAELEASGVGDNALGAGDTLPDCTLTSATGETVNISSLLAKGPMIISFYRGGWCPYCNLELRAYQEILGEIEAIGAQLVAVTPEKPDASMTTAERNELKFPVLTDNGNAFAKELGICFELPVEIQKFYQMAGLDLPALNPGAGWTLPISAMYVVDRNGSILLAHVERDYRTRPEPSQAVTALNRSIPSDS